MSELSSMAGLHNHAHTHIQRAETDTQFFFSAQWEAAAKHSAERIQLFVCDHTEDSPNVVYMWC